jgi:hypothetical protein
MMKRIKRELLIKQRQSIRNKVVVVNQAGDLPKKRFCGKISIYRR